MITCEMDNITFEQRVYCCKQPTGEWAVGLCWTPITDNWKSYSPADLPETFDKNSERRRYPSTQWRDAKKYASSLCAKYNLSAME